MTNKGLITMLITFMILGLFLAQAVGFEINKDITFSQSSIACNIQGSVVNLQVRKFGENNVTLFDLVTGRGTIASIETVENWVGHPITFNHKTNAVRIIKL